MYRTAQSCHALSSPFGSCTEIAETSVGKRKNQVGTNPSVNKYAYA